MRDIETCSMPSPWTWPDGRRHHDRALHGTFEEAFDLSDRIVPCVHYDGRALWLAGPRDQGPGADPASAGRYRLRAVGVLDLRRIGRGQGIDAASQGRSAPWTPASSWAAVELDLPALRSAGMKGAFMDPFTPVIGDLIVEDDGAARGIAPVPALHAKDGRAGRVSGCAALTALNGQAIVARSPRRPSGVCSAYVPRGCAEDRS